MSVLGNKVYSNGSLVLTLATSTGACGFTEFVHSDSTNQLILVDGTDGYVFSSPSTYTQISINNIALWTASTAHIVNDLVRPTTSTGLIYRCTVAGTGSATEPTWPTTAGGSVTDGTITWVAEEFAFPSPHVPAPVFMDGFLFLAKAGTQDVYNSNLDDPLNWTPGDFFTAEMYPDRIVSLSKNNNYLYAIGTNSGNTNLCGIKAIYCPNRITAISSFTYKDNLFFCLYYRTISSTAKLLNSAGLSC